MARRAEPSRRSCGGSSHGAAGPRRWPCRRRRSGSWHRPSRGRSLARPAPATSWSCRCRSGHGSGPAASLSGRVRPAVCSICWPPASSAASSTSIQSVQVIFVSGRTRISAQPSPAWIETVWRPGKIRWMMSPLSIIRQWPSSGTSPSKASDAVRRLSQGLRLDDADPKARLDRTGRAQAAEHPVEIPPKLGAFGRYADDLPVEGIATLSRRSGQAVRAFPASA